MQGANGGNIWMRGVITGALVVVVSILAFTEGVHESRSFVQKQTPGIGQHFREVLSKKQLGQSARWYLRWLALRKKKPSSVIQKPPEVKDVNIQSDVPGCRDDLCIADELDYFDQETPPEVSTVDPSDVACPQGYAPIVRNGIIYCDVVRETTEDPKKEVICADDEERVITNGLTECIPRHLQTTTVTDDAVTGDELKTMKTTCKPGEILMDNGNGSKVCVDSGSIDRRTKLGGSTELPITTTSQFATITDLPHVNTSPLSTETKLNTPTEITPVNTSPFSTISDCPLGEEKVKTDTGFLCRTTTDTPDVTTSPVILKCPPGQEQSDHELHECVPISNHNVGSGHVTSSRVTDSSGFASTTERNPPEGTPTATPPSGLTGSPSNINTLPSLTGKSGYKSKGKTGKHKDILEGISTVTPLSGFDGSPTNINTLPSLTGKSGYKSKGKTGKPKHVFSDTVTSKPSFGHSSGTNNPPIILLPGLTVSPPILNSLPPLTGESGYQPNGKTGRPKEGYQPNKKSGKPKHPINKGSPPLIEAPHLLPDLISNGMSGKLKKQNINHLKGIIPIKGKGKFGQHIMDPKTSPCRDGKVLAGTLDGYECVDPVFPEGVCPEDRVPHLSSMGIQCIPCPFGQYPASIDGGVKCVVTATSSTFEMVTEQIDVDQKPCPDGLIPFDTAAGRICKYVPPSAPVESLSCPSGQTAVFVDGEMQCRNRDNECPPGLVSMVTETGQNVCGFDSQGPIENCNDVMDDDCPFSKPGGNGEYSDNFCPPGLEVVMLSTGQPSCQYIVEDIGHSPTLPKYIVEGHDHLPTFPKYDVDDHDKLPTLPKYIVEGHGHLPTLPKYIVEGHGNLPTLPKYIVEGHDHTPTLLRGRCGPDDIVTQTDRGFFCQPAELIPDHVRSSCSDGEVLAKLGPHYSCITDYEANLVCNEREELTRLPTGFICREILDESVGSPCGPDEVVDTDENGHIQCISLSEAQGKCGDGFIAVRNGDGFMCKQQTVDVKCPEGFVLKLVRGSPACVSTTGPECRDIDGSMSTLCLTDLETPNEFDLDLETILEPKTDCAEGLVPSIVDGSLVCAEEPMVNCGEGLVPNMIDGITVCVEEHMLNCEGGLVPNIVDGIPVCMEPMINPTGQVPCESDGVRPCDLDLAILLEGCNPDCANGGSCVNGRCQCLAGITGSGCSEDINECSSIGDSICEYQCENTFGSYQCICPAGKVIGRNGLTCEETGCIPDCLNGGQCIRGTCQCPAGFEGDYCQIDKDECSLHGGRLCQHYCRNTYGGYQCICPPGSRLNDDQRTCINTTCIPECRNGGSCENHKCYCPPGFYGFVCQLDLNECYKQDPCQDKCINTWGSYTCSCEHGKKLAPDGHSCI